MNSTGDNFAPNGVGGDDSSFNRSILSLLARAEYRRCETGEDREAIYRLRYRAYLAQHLVPPMKEQAVKDRWDDAPNAMLYGVYFDDRLVSSLRIHHITAAEPFGAVMGVFADLIEPRLARGETFVNKSQFVADPETASFVRAIPYLTLRLAVMANVYFQTDGSLGIIREEHAAFYRRFFDSRRVGQPRPYPPFTVPVMLYETDCRRSVPGILEKFSFFRSSPLEQRLLFARSTLGGNEPLTVLPTPRYVEVAA